MPVSAIRVPAVDAADCRASGFGNYENVASAIACIFAKEFNLSVSGASLLFHSNQQVFESSLVGANRLDAAYARQTASWAVALTTPHVIFVNEAALNRLLWPERVHVLAHELVHSLQYGLAGGRRGTSDQWLREGIAEWMASSIVHSLRLGSLRQRRATAVMRLRKLGLGETLPALHRMVTFHEFAELRSSLGTYVTYDQAFIASDFLIQRYGLQSAIQYFRLFAQSDDRLHNFRTAFGKDLSSFEDDFRAHLQRILP